MKIACIVGTRPEVIKMAPVVFALRERPEFDCRLWSTGQHRELLDQALATFGMTPDEDLSVMTGNQSLAQLTASLLTQLDALVTEDRPDAILAQGDTTTVMVSGLIGYYHRIPLGHVEAGLRTWDRFAPYPEEINRTVMGRLADWHFAPTAWAAENLKREGVPDQQILVTGNTIIDALLWVRRKINQTSPEVDQALKTAVQGRLVLVTGHRRESFGAGFEELCRGLLAMVEDHPDIQLVYAVHLNPNVQEPVWRVLGGHPRITLTPPLSYQTLVWLMDRSTLVITDSGGIQEEAPALGKPVLVMRDTTERPEGLAAGVCRLVGTSAERIRQEADRLLTDESAYRAMSQAINPYGDGQAAQRIAQHLAQYNKASSA